MGKVKDICTEIELAYEKCCGCDSCGWFPLFCEYEWYLDNNEVLKEAVETRKVTLPCLCFDDNKCRGITLYLDDI